MRSNIEQAVADVIASNKEVALANVFDAYTRIAGLAYESVDAVTAFERALDKHPDSREKRDSESAQFVVEVRRDYLRKMFAKGAKPPTCACCADLMQHMMNGNVETVEKMLSWPGEEVGGMSLLIFLASGGLREFHSYTKEVKEETA